MQRQQHRQSCVISPKEIAYGRAPFALALTGCGGRIGGVRNALTPPHRDGSHRGGQSGCALQVRGGGEGRRHYQADRAGAAVSPRQAYRGKSRIVQLQSNIYMQFNSIYRKHSNATRLNVLLCMYVLCAKSVIHIRVSYWCCIVSSVSKIGTW